MGCEPNANTFAYAMKAGYLIKEKEKNGKENEAGQGRKKLGKETRGP